MTRLFRTHLVPALQRWGATVVDGGTDAGIMRLIGQERSAAAADFGLIGVAAIGTVAHPLDGEPRGDTDLEPHHPVVLLVPGTAWGDEVPWLSDVATAIAAGSSAATLLVNGGDIAYDDVRHSVGAGRPVVVVAGSGRTSDDIGAAVDGRESSDRARELVRSGLVTSSTADDPHSVVDVLGPGARLLLARPSGSGAFSAAARPKDARGAVPSPPASAGTCAAPERSSAAATTPRVAGPGSAPG